MVELATAIWADGPVPNPHEPDKEQIRTWGTWVEEVITASESNITVSVGSGGDFPTINAAVERLSSLRGPAYKKNGLQTIIMLKTGFVVEEQLVVIDLDMGRLTIAAEDAEVVIRRSALSQTVDSIYYPAFAALGANAVLPVINALFSMDTSGADPTYRNGVFLSDGARGHVMPNAGVKNAGGRGLHVANGSVCKARSSIFTGAGEACVRASHAFVEVRQAILTGGYKGLMLGALAVVDAEDANISNSTYAGIENYASSVRFGNGIANSCQKAVEQYGGRMEARFASFDDSVTNAIELREGAWANLRSASIERAGERALFVSSSEAFAGDANLTNAGRDAILAIGGKVNAPTANLTNAGGLPAGGFAVNAQDGSVVNVQGATGTGASGEAGNGVSYMNYNGSTINANGATGTAGRTVNSLSRMGIIYKET